MAGLHFDYTLDRAGEPPIADAGSDVLSSPAGYDLREYSDHEETVARDGFDTLIGTTGGPPLEETVNGVAVTLTDVTVTRYGFWDEHGWAAVEIGQGKLAAEVGGEAWSGTFRTAHAWTAGESPSGTNPAGTGSATWSGIAEAVRTDGFARLPGTAELRIADLSRPLVDADIDLDDGGAGVALEWRDMPLSVGSFGEGTAGTDRIDGRFHGPDHGEAWGVFDTGEYVGAFGARKQP